MNLSFAIVNKLQREHLGKDYPIKLDPLLLYLEGIGAIKDRFDKDEQRKVRAVIAEYPEICNAGQGYYWARGKGHKEDIDATLDYLDRTYIAPIAIKKAKKKVAFPQYYPRFNPNQGELF